MDPALKAHLGGAALPGLLAAPDDLVERHQVRRPAEVRRQLPFREGAEATAEVADVGVVDVARDHVGDVLAADLPPERVCFADDRGEVAPAGREERRHVLFVELDAAVHLRERCRDRFRRSAVPPLRAFSFYARRGEEAGYTIQTGRAAGLAVVGGSRRPVTLAP